MNAGSGESVRRFADIAAGSGSKPGFPRGSRHGEGEDEFKMQTMDLTYRLADREDLSRTGFKAVFDNFFSSQRPLFSLSEKVWNPPADVYETPENVVIKMEIAGVSQEQLEISVEGNFLVIRGCRREDTPHSKENFHLMEIRYGRFERVFGMPVKLRAETINAQYSNGFLLVTIAKASLLPQQIAIDMQQE